MGVYRHAKLWGIPEESCMNYVAHNAKQVNSTTTNEELDYSADDFSLESLYGLNDNYQACAPILRCKACSKPAVSNYTSPDNETQCRIIEDYPVWKVSEYGILTGAHQMKAEIYRRGPISCAM